MGVCTPDANVSCVMALPKRFLAFQGPFRQIVRRLKVLQFLITVAVQSHEGTHFLLADEQALLTAADIRAILATESLSRDAMCPSRDAKALVCAIVNAVDAILLTDAHSAENSNGTSAHMYCPGLDECIGGLGDLASGGYRPCGITEQANPSSIAAKMLDSRLYHVAQMCVSAQRKLETAEQVERPREDAGDRLVRQHVASASHPDEYRPLGATGSPYSLAMQTPFIGGTVQTPFSGQAPAMIFNNALLWYDSPHVDPSASHERQVSSSEVCFTPLALPPSESNYCTFFSVFSV